MQNQDRLFFTHFTCKKDFCKKAFLTLFFSGLSPKASGTIGSLIALLLGIGIGLFSVSTLLLLALLVGAIAIKIIDSYEQEGLGHDSQAIVIDELVGMWISMALLGIGIVELTLAFVLFRLFDIWKPSIIGRIDKHTKGGLGVIGDDVIAGFFSGILGLIILKVLSIINAHF